MSKQKTKTEQRGPSGTRQQNKRKLRPMNSQQHRISEKGKERWEGLKFQKQKMVLSKGDTDKHIIWRHALKGTLSHSILRLIHIQSKTHDTTTKTRTRGGSLCTIRIFSERPYRQSAARPPLFTRHKHRHIHRLKHTKLIGVKTQFTNSRSSLTILEYLYFVRIPFVAPVISTRQTLRLRLVSTGKRQAMLNDNCDQQWLIIRTLHLHLQSIVCAPVSCANWQPTFGGMS